MAKPKTSLKEPDIDNRLIDERGPTAQRLAKVPYAVGDTGTLTVHPSPIDRAFGRDAITQRQYRAANKFHMHWYNAHMAGSMGSSDPNKIFGDSFSISRLCATEMAEFHYNRFRQALRAIEEKVSAAGYRPDHATQILVWVVCEELTFREAGEKIGFRGTAAETRALTTMRSNLNILIDEWGL